MTFQCLCVKLNFFCISSMVSGLVVAADGPVALSSEQRAAIVARLEELESRLDQTRPAKAPPDSAEMDRWASADIFRKGVRWALRYDPAFLPADIQLIDRSLDAGLEAANQLKMVAPREVKSGRQVRGFVSDVDGSTQPYGLVIPDSLDLNNKVRLDVVLHGSSRPVGLSELRFMARFTNSQAVPANDFIELHPLGRVENCYRWSGETDVFEAIESVCRNFLIDRDRIVLRGMSMGASGTWHLGLKHPDRFVALGPYCGYVDTHQFSRTPLPNFIPVPELSPLQESGLHLLDSVDYAANASVVPPVAAMGEKDIFFDAHVIMGEAFRRERLEMVNLISPGTGHVVDPATQAEQMARIAVPVANGRTPNRRNLRFVTWTLKYDRCYWLRLLSLDQQLKRAEFEAAWPDDDTLAVTRVDNIRGFGIDLTMASRTLSTLRISGQTISVTGVDPGGLALFWRENGTWHQIMSNDDRMSKGKRPGLQGPIDDAFSSNFVCVRGTGKPWHEKTQAWSDARLAAFAREWEQYFRGELPIKRDDEVTSDDLAKRNLILFGDPGSNRIMADILVTGKLPLTWSKDEFRIGGLAATSSEHVPLLVQPNPLTTKPRYVVFNSGHTFGAAELGAVNYLLFPRIGDWAVIRADLSSIRKSDPRVFDEPGLVGSGFFDESWK